MKTAACVYGCQSPADTHSYYYLITILCMCVHELTQLGLDAEPSDLNVKMDFNGSPRVARSLTGDITDQSFTPGVSAGSQTVQERQN